MLPLSQCYRHIPPSNQQHLNSVSEQVFIASIPPLFYRAMENMLCQQYGFLNGVEQGGRMRLADCFVGIRQALAEELFQLGKQLCQQLPTPLAGVTLPEGFSPFVTNLSPLEQQGKPAFFHLDAAVTADGVKLIEFQAVPTYQVTAARLGELLRQDYLPDSGLFLGGTGDYTWQDFKRILRDILVSENATGNILVDRDVHQQKTRFEFYATQQEIDPVLEIVDSRDLFEQDGRLFYRDSDGENIQVNRLYNRVLALEALFDDHYPHNPERWHFRYDRHYEGLQYCNHPAYSLTFAKQALTQICHPFNPACHELAELAPGFANGELPFADYVWKHKLGVAGREIFLSPSQHVMQRLQAADTLDQYIAQQKIHFDTFLMENQQEKIVEVRLMFVQSSRELIAVPMARIGHMHKTATGQAEARIHFGDNNRPGYGFAPAIIYT